MSVSIIFNENNIHIINPDRRWLLCDDDENVTHVAVIGTASSGFKIDRVVEKERELELLVPEGTHVRFVVEDDENWLIYFAKDGKDWRVCVDVKGPFTGERLNAAKIAVWEAYIAYLEALGLNEPAKRDE